MKYNIEIEDATIKFSYVKEFVNRDLAQNIRMCPRLSERHIQLTNFSKMKVRLAAQLFSHGVAAGHMTYVSLGALESSAQQTAEFIEIIDHLF